MRGEELLDRLELVDEKYVDEAERFRAKKQRRWVRWTAAAACVCLLAAGAGLILRRLSAPGAGTLSAQESGEAASAQAYFRDNRPGGEAEAKPALAEVPYSETRLFGSRRAELEEAGVLPRIDTHPLFELCARYLESGELHSVEIGWYRRNAEGLADYSDLTVTAAPGEIELLSDTVDARAESNVTVTEREGVQIVGRGVADTNKTLTWQTEAGWYQVSGSWNDSFEDVVSLLDWFWEHPLDFAQFPMEAGDTVRSVSLSERPDAFSELLPDFPSFALTLTDGFVVLKNGGPVHYEAHWSDGTNEDFLHWCVEAEPDVYELEGAAGALEELTQALVTDRIAAKGRISFLQAGCVVTVYSRAPQAVWALIESIRS